MRLSVFRREHEEPGPLLGDRERDGILQPGVVQAGGVVGDALAAGDGLGFSERLDLAGRLLA